MGGGLIHAPNLGLCIRGNAASFVLPGLRRFVPTILPPSLLGEHRVLSFLMSFGKDGIQMLEFVTCRLGEEEVNLRQDVRCSSETTSG